MEGSHTDPLKLLPTVFEKYLNFPRKIAFISIVLLIISVGLFSMLPAGFFDESSQETYSQGNLDEASTVSIPSPFSISLSTNSSNVQITEGSALGQSVVKISNELLELHNEQGLTTASLKNIASDDGQISEIYNQSGTLLYSTKPDDDGYKVLTPDRALVARIKFKEEKFNIYDSSGQRTYYGKNKKGSILIRDDAGSDVAWITASSTPSLNQIAPLCLPLADEYRALLYANELLKAGSL